MWLHACRAAPRGALPRLGCLQGTGGHRCQGDVTASRLRRGCGVCLSMEVSSKAAGSKVGSRGIGRGVSSEQGWCPRLEPARGHIPPRGMAVMRTGRARRGARKVKETPLCPPGCHPLQPAERSTFTCLKPCSPGCWEGLAAGSALLGSQGMSQRPFPTLRLPAAAPSSHAPQTRAECPSTTAVMFPVSAGSSSLG